MGNPGANRVSRLPSATGNLARLAYAKVQAAGIAPGPLLKKAGLSRFEIENTRVRLKVQDQIAFLNAAASALKDDFLGFHLAQNLDLREVGLLYYVLASSEKLIDALQRAARYSSIVNDGVSSKCIDGKAVSMSLQYVGVSRYLDRHQIEFWMATIVRACRQLTGLRLLPLRVRFIHLREHDSVEFSEIFGDKIEFGASADEIIFPLGIRHLPVVSADPYLNVLLVTYCEEALSKRRSKNGSFRSNVENAIVPLLPHGKARSETVARQLGLSQRTLARRLSKEGLTFSYLLEYLKVQLANRYLADEDLAISQIAWFLGYQEVGAFSHAFRRWTGKTPRQARSKKIHVAHPDR